jgi:hypothetical protein
MPASVAHGSRRTFYAKARHPAQRDMLSRAAWTVFARRCPCRKHGSNMT